MRSLFVPSFALVACASSPPEPAATAPNVRARLAAPTRLLLAPGSTGSIVAKQWTQGGWQSGTLALQLADGDVTAVANSDGQLALTELRIDLAPIAIPDSVFGKPAQLQDVQLALAMQPPMASAQWSDANDATATATVQLDLSWAIFIDGAATPLGTQHLAALPLAIALGGDGSNVHATLQATAAGEVWSWAGLLELDDLSLALDASTSD